MNLIHLLPDLITNVMPMIDVPDVHPEFQGPFIGALLQIANLAFGVATILCIVAIGVAGAILAFGNLDARHKSTGWMVILGAAVGAMVLGSASGIMTFFLGIPLI